MGRRTNKPLKHKGYQNGKQMKQSKKMRPKEESVKFLFYLENN